MPAALKHGEDFVSIEAHSKEGRQLYSLTRPIDLDQGRIAEAGFQTDWGSVPKKIDDWFGIDNRRGSVGYLRHDFNYQTGCKARILADLELLRDQKAEGLSFLERYLVFWGLRLAGKAAYARYRSYSETQG